MSTCNHCRFYNKADFLLEAGAITINNECEGVKPMPMFIGARPGKRNTVGHELVKYFRQLEKNELIEKLITCWNEKNRPPLSDIEIAQLCKEHKES